MELSFSKAQSPERLIIAAPATADLAPPGYYLLFVVGSSDGAEVPGIARWVALSAQPPDNTVPGQVTDLEVVYTTESSFGFRVGTVAADDGYNLLSGCNASYEIRRSSSFITPGNYSQATLVSSPPTPGCAGDEQLFEITDLTPDTRYYFALKLRDEAGNWSALSNCVVSRTTEEGGGGEGTRAQQTGGRTDGDAGTTSDPFTPASFSATSTLGASGSAAGALLVVERASDTPLPGWNIYRAVHEQIEGLEGLGARGFVVQERASDGLWRTLGTARGVSSRVGLCALSGARRLVMLEPGDVAQVPLRARGYEVADASRAALGAVAADSATLLAPALESGDTLRIAYETTSPSAGDGDWLLLLRPASAASALHGRRAFEPPIAPTAYRFALAPARPNPFASGTTIGFTLPGAADVRLEVFDLAGRRVRTLASGRHEAGAHEARWDGCAESGAVLPAGLYVCRLRAGHDRAQQRVVLAP